MSRIKNLVFDLGGVVFTWNPDQIIESVFQDAAAHQKVKDHIFRHEDWVGLDRGTLDREEAITRAVVRTGLAETDVSALMRQIPRALAPIPQTFELIRRIKHNTRHKLFVLSNMHVASIHHIEQHYPIEHLFDGQVISCRIHLVKPEREIYRYLLETFDLQASDTVFIDDSPENLESAEKVGIHTIRFKTPEQCEGELKRLDCL